MLYSSIEESHKCFILKAIRSLKDGIHFSPLPVALSRKDVPRLAGVYILYEAGKMIYVGQAADIRGRLNPIQHHVYDGEMLVSWMPVQNKLLRKAVEDALIFCFTPKHNESVPVYFYAGQRIEKLIDQCQKADAVQLRF